MPVQFGEVHMRCVFMLFAFLAYATAALAQETPLFVVYDDGMEEPGNLEVSIQSTIQKQKNGGPSYWAPYGEFEYGVMDWWTASLYIEAAAQRRDAMVFTGYRIESRFRPLRGDHAINPILYFEFEDVNEASRIQKEVVGHTEPTLEPLSELVHQKARELEGKLILSSDVHKWNISENFIVEKNLSEDEGYEFGYAIGAYRPLSTKTSARHCRWCRARFVAGAEVYGGLGSTKIFGFSDTAQYVSPGLMWRGGDGSSLKISPAFGLTAGSARMLLRVGYTFEIEGFGRKVGHIFRHE